MFFFIFSRSFTMYGSWYWVFSYFLVVQLVGDFVSIAVQSKK